MSIFASVDPRRLGWDPQPYVADDGSRWGRGSAATGLMGDTVYAPRPEYAPATAHPANVILVAARDHWDTGDPFGSAMSWMFATLQHWQEWQDPRIGTVPPEYGFEDRGGHGGFYDPATGEDFEYWEINRACNLYLEDKHDYANAIVQDMIVHAAAVFHRIIAQATLNGKDY